MTEQTLRAFVAVELPVGTHEVLATIQNELRSAMGRASAGVRWTRPESVHVTLQFLGDIPSSRVSEITAAIADACAGAKPLHVALNGIGAFPNVTRPRVLWIGLEGDIGKLSSLAAGIAERLKPLGYKPDKPFQPHITLGRVRETVRPEELRAISQALATQARHPTTTAFTVGSISLMQSHLQPGGSVYTQLANVKLD
jgi:2'-5' RNA ligase